MARLKVNIILTAGNEAVQAAKNATQTISIVMAFSGDPVGASFVANLARPGGNITGLSRINIEVTSKRLELLNETVPSATRIAVLFNPAGRVPVLALKEAQAAVHQAHFAAVASIFGALLSALSHPANAQESSKVHWIGFSSL